MKLYEIYNYKNNYILNNSNDTQDNNELYIPLS
jgi:hypothetical protein